MSILLIRGDARRIPLADNSVNCCVTSPPYWGLRDYGMEGQLGLERTPEEYIAKMVEVFREVKRVLRDDGTIWVNMGDSYCADRGNSAEKPGHDNKAVHSTLAIRNHKIAGNGLKPKDLVGIPWMLAFALRTDGWYLRSDIIWAKPNPMPESVTDRPTKAHEYIFLLSKSEKYYYDDEAIKEPVTGEAHPRGNGVNPKARPLKDSGREDQGLKVSDRFGRGAGFRKKQAATGNRRYEGFNERWDQREASRNKQNESFSAAVSGLVDMRNKRTVWEVSPQPFPEAHFATFPEELIKPCILAGCPEGGVVLDPFAGSGTTLLVARNNQCHAVGIELSEPYLAIARRRLAQDVLAFV